MNSILPPIQFDRNQGGNVRKSDEANAFLEGH